MVSLRADARLNTKQECENHSGKPSDSDCLHRPAGACHHYTHLHCKQRTFFAPTGADCRDQSLNPNLLALHAYTQSESVTSTRLLSRYTWENLTNGQGTLPFIQVNKFSKGFPLCFYSQYKFVYNSVGWNQRPASMNDFNFFLFSLVIPRKSQDNTTN